MMSNFLFVGNGPYLNRGCEAIVRGSAVVLRKFFDSPKFVSVNFDLGSGFYPQEVDPDITHIPVQLGFGSYTWFVRNIFRLFGTTWFPILEKQIPQSAAVLALGGDNYSLDYGRPELFLDLIDYTISRKCPYVIWGASVGPFAKLGPEYERYVLKKLKKATAIFVREDISFHYLVEHGLAETVRRVADPAFTMEPSPPQCLGFDIPEGAIGLNLSPLLAQYLPHGSSSGAYLSLIIACIEQILKQFGRPVILIPHVTVAHSNDYDLLNKVFDNFYRQGKPVYLLSSELPAQEIKWVIGKLTCFAGARTHSTIAALSSGVPTLSFAYSIKAKGINQDIFGHDEYTLDPHQITPETVTNSIGLLLKNEKEIRQTLSTSIPEVKERAFQAGAYLREILG